MKTMWDDGIEAKGKKEMASSCEQGRSVTQNRDTS